MNSSNLTSARRGTALLTALGALALFALLGPSGPGQPLGALSADEAEAAKCGGASRSPKRLGKRRARQLVVCLINRRRSKAGVRRLDKKREVARAATRHTKRMKSSNCFSHTCPGEAPLSGRLRQTDYLPCGCSWGAGETIAWGKGRGEGSPRAVVDAWMRSPSHRGTMLARGFEHIGVGYRRGSPFSGSAKAATYTIDFGYKR